MKEKKRKESRTHKKPRSTVTGFTTRRFQCFLTRSLLSVPFANTVSESAHSGHQLKRSNGGRD